MGTAEEGEEKCAGLLVSESPLACSVFYLRSFFKIKTPQNGAYGIW
jgi:hypothetical protein